MEHSSLKLKMQIESIELKDLVTQAVRNGIVKDIGNPAFRQVELCSGGQIHMDLFYKISRALGEDSLCMFLGSELVRKSDE